MTTTNRSVPSPSVLTFGEPLVVLVPDAPGTITITHQLRPYPAGAELNTAVGLARLGINSSFVSSVGADPFGQIVLRSGRAEGVDMRFVAQDPSAPTGVFFKMWSGLQGKTSVYYYRSASPMAIGHWEPSPQVYIELEAGSWSWVHSTGVTWMISPDSWRKSTDLFKFCHSLSIPVSFDVNVRLKLGTVDEWRKCVHEVLPYIRWFLLGDEEAQLLFDTDKATEVEQHIQSYGFTGKGVMLKRGEHGAVASIRGVVTEVPAWSVSRVVDAVGAGDGYNAGWLAGMLRGWSLKESMRLGSLVGAFAVTSVGDYEGYPTWPEVVQEMSGKGAVER